ncbi:hypothetical protein MACH24_06450 [Erythrobacter sp. Dej080120_24]|nr:hypothetical protein MACH24_06450 [Erythrobacter sp. Dej080120_24]
MAAPAPPKARAAAAIERVNVVLRMIVILVLLVRHKSCDEAPEKTSGTLRHRLGIGAGPPGR